ncbi:putative membrane protein [Streptosporangium becharense]|uniref:Putative membrane protein n=1 Tax=Streptosporangium becharense TaxID=1816182 RepID=A0A7W9IGH9_9ACTN|nr:SRPBCC family protein [Streptosporangium becharense]MBB2908856.1 putative membrane protein [Streptosporangium becharense]MBB5820126.1 putative membrane protein [Streptosporangium becharense]
MTNRLARALGWASLGLGAAQVAAPGAVGRLAGIGDSAPVRGTVVLVGARELFHAMLLLGSRVPAPWVWTRVAGDILDLTMLGRAVATRAGRRRLRVVAVTGAVAGIAAADLWTALRASRRGVGGPDERAGNLYASITVNRPRQEVYRYWRDIENLPRFMIHLESVRVTGDGHSRWRVKAPANLTVEWDAEIVEDRPGEMLAWRSLPGSTVGSGGLVRFADAPGGRGTEVRVELRYDVPGGRIGLAVARLLGEHPEQQVRDDLRRFKQIVETGEVVRSEGSPEGTRAFRQVTQRPAQPVMRGFP